MENNRNDDQEPDLLLSDEEVIQRRQISSHASSGHIPYYAYFMDRKMWQFFVHSFHFGNNTVH